MKENESKTQKKPASILKNVLNTVVNILIVIVLITSVLIAVLALTSKSSGISTIFGYTIQTIQSDSMKGGSPDGYGGKDFEKGDLMIAKATEFDPKAEYDLGDIVTYIKSDTDGSAMLIVHRISDVYTDENGFKRYQTWGDNREMDPDPDQATKEYYLLSSQIASVYYTKNYEGAILKGVGNVMDFLRSQQGFFFVVLLPMIIFFIYELIRVILNFGDYRKAQAEEDKQAAVKAALAEQNGDSKPEEFTPEQMEQFKQFLAQQKEQNKPEE